MKIRDLFHARRSRVGAVRRPKAKIGPVLEALESRVVLFSASGNAWMNPAAITISFMPDGTNLGGVQSNLLSSFNNNPRLAGRWQAQVLRAAQVWAQQTNLNVVVVPDNGAPSGSGDYQQGDPGYGDIRIGGFNFGNSTLARAYMPPPVNNFSLAGDITFNTRANFGINTNFDLFTVATHEFGHGLGLNHSSSSGLAQMYPSYNGAKPNLNSDDIAGIRNIYSGNLARPADAYDALGLGNSLATAASLDSHIDPSTATALVNNLDITTTTDSDAFSFVAPQNSGGSLAVNVQSSGLSLLTPRVTVYAADQATILGTASGQSQYGTTLTVNVGGVTAGTPYYVVVQGADTSAFSTGKYALALNFGNGPTPTAPSASYPVANGSPISFGGGAADSAGESHDFLNEVPVVTGIGDDTGLSTNDGVTNDPTLTISGQAPEDSTVRVYLDGKFIGTTVVGQEGTHSHHQEKTDETKVKDEEATHSHHQEKTDETTWSFDYTGTTLPDGMYTITAVAVDPLGNVSAPSESYTIIINTQAPAAPTLDGISPDTGSSDRDGITNARTSTLNGTAAPNSLVTISRDGWAVGSTHADSSGGWSYPSGVSLDGTFAFSATATDLAGNVGAASKPFLLTLDTVTSAPIIAGVIRLDRSQSPIPTLVVEGTAEANSTVVISLNGRRLGTAAADGAGNWSYNHASANGFASGLYGLSAIATDVAGNVGAPSSVFKLLLGGGAPTASTPWLVDGFLAGLFGHDPADTDATPLIVGWATPGSVVTLLDGNTILGTTKAGVLGFYYFVSPTLAAGTHTLFAEATNKSGATGLLSGGVTFTV